MAAVLCWPLLESLLQLMHCNTAAVPAPACCCMQPVMPAVQRLLHHCGLVSGRHSLPQHSFHHCKLAAAAAVAGLCSGSG